MKSREGGLMIYGIYVPIIVFAKAGQIDKVQECIKSGCDVNEKDASGTCAIIEAAKRNDLDMVKILIKAGAKRLVQNRFKESTLSWATFHHNDEMLEVLKNGILNSNQNIDQDRSNSAAPF